MVWYEIAASKSDGFWWSPKQRKWLDKPNGGCMSNRPLGSNGQKAWKEFRKMGSGYILLKLYRIKGVTYLDQWEK